MVQSGTINSTKVWHDVDKPLVWRVPTLVLEKAQRGSSSVSQWCGDQQNLGEQLTTLQRVRKHWAE